MDDVRLRVEAISAARRDDAVAHDMEDDLFADVLRAIAGGQCADPSALAYAALASLDIGFSRWCA